MEGGSGGNLVVNVWLFLGLMGHLLYKKYMGCLALPMGKLTYAKKVKKKVTIGNKAFLCGFKDNIENTHIL